MPQDDLQSILHGTPSGPDPLSETAPMVSGAGQDELMKTLHGPEGERPIDARTKDFLQTGQERGLGETLGRGIARGWGQTEAMVPQLKAVYKEYNGDLPGAQAEMAKAEEISKPYGESDWNLQNIHSPSDFGYWVTEKLGEQGVNMLSMMATGGVGGLSAKVAAQSLLQKGLIGEASARAMMIAGGSVPTYGLTTAMETANTAEEQFKVTGSTQPERSLGFGAAKGVLELYTPLSISRALLTPGLQLGKSLPGAIAKTAAKEGATEGAQEAIDIYARKLAQPDYSYFKDGPTLMPSGWGEGMWRLAEASAAGAVVGGIYGAPFARMEQNQENRAAIGTEAPGTRQTFMPEPAQISQPTLSLPKGLTFTESEKNDHGQINFEIYKGDTRVGRAYVRERPEINALQIGNINLDPEYQRQGIATALQDYLEKKYQQVVMPDVTLSEAEYNRWKKIDPESVIAYSKKGDTWYGDPKWSDNYRIKRATELQTNPQLKAGEIKAKKTESLLGGVPPVYASQGPISALRQMVLRPASQDKTLQEALQKDPKSDALSIGPLLADLKLGEAQHEAFLDMLDAATPRYTELHPNADQSRIFTNTELELHDALNRPAAEKPKWLRVNQASLQPAAITAHLSDLPPAGSERIYFPPRADGTQVPQETKIQALALYDTLQRGLDERVNPQALATASEYNDREALLKPHYDTILTMGLRVIPSRGAGFYYNGTIDYHGLPIEDVKRSQRYDREIAFYDPVLRTLRKAEGEEGPPYNSNYGGVDGYVLVTVDRNKLRPDDFKILPDGSLELTKPLDPSWLTPGIYPTHRQRTEMQMQQADFIPTTDGKSVVTVDRKDQRNPASNEIKRTVDKALPVIDQILKKLGIEGNIHVSISDAYQSGIASAQVTEGVIGISPSAMATRYETSEHAVLNILMHELGHFITFRYWSKLPVEIQDGLNYSWEKAVLAGRMGVFGKSGMGPVMQEQNAYWLTLSEWLAEQFRRWSTSNSTPTTILDKYLKDGSKKLEAFYKEWERTLGKNAVMDLSRPDHFFSGMMDYLQGYAAVDKPKLQQALKRNTLYSAPQDILDSPFLTGVANTVISATESMNKMIPRDLQIQLKNSLGGAISIYQMRQGKNLDFIEMALSALPSEAEIQGGASRVYLAHELIHAYEERGYFTPEELKLLTKEARQNQGKLLSAQEVSKYRAEYKAQLEAQGVAKEQMEASLQRHLEKELRANYVASFANTGVAFSEQSKTIFARFMAILESIRNYFNKLGYQTKEDLLRAIFKGEMVHRIDKTAEEAQVTEFFAQADREVISAQRQFALAPVQEHPVKADKHFEVEPGVMMHVRYLNGEERNSQGKLQSKAATYFFTQNSNLVGSVKLYYHGPKGYEIRGVQAQMLGKLSWAYQMLEHVSKDTGIPLQNQSDPYNQLLKPPGIVTKAAMPVYKLWARGGHPDAKKILGTYVTEKGVDYYYSPNYVKNMLVYYRLEKIRGKAGEYSSNQSLDSLIALYTKLRSQIDDSYYKDERTTKLFSLKRNFERDEVQGSLLRSGQQADEAKLMQSMGFPSGNAQEAFGANFALKQKLSQGENARQSGLSFELSAPSSMYSFGMRHIWEFATGMGGDPRNRKELANLKHDVDRIGRFQKHWISLQQLASINEHIVPLQQLIQNEELAGQISSKWERQAGETAHEWDNGRSPARKEAISKTLFDLTELNYLQKGQPQALPDGWQAWLNGGPAQGNLLALFKTNKLTIKDQDLIKRIQNDFQGFLWDSRQYLASNLQKTFAASPQQLTNAMTKLNADMALLQQKPYFPMVRFGEFTIAVRQNKQVVWSSAYGTQRERDAAVKEVRKQHPQGEITIGRIPLNVVEFASLPPALLGQIKENLLDENKPGLSPDQITLIQEQKQWIEEFEMLHMPDKTFRKRWLPSKGLPGYSMDAMRAYSHYFQSGARYLARLAYMKEMRQNVNDLQGRAMTMGDYAKPKAIADYAASWLNYYLEGGKDGGKLRAAAAIWYLGFSPAAAVMNLTQPLFVTWPKLTADFGAKAGPAFVNASTYIRKRSYATTKDPLYTKARDEMVRQNYIDLGQAAELATFSEGNNLSRLKAGTKIQAFWRKLSFQSMRMFQWAEHYNREVTLRASWDLAMKNPQVERLKKLATVRLLEIQDLQARLGMSEQEAVALLYAKEVIQRTQFIYNKTSDPPFMRGKAKDFFIFFKYTQNMLWAFGHNGAALHMLIMFAFFYGLQGLPGSDDANELLRRLGQAIWGKDWDLHGMAREFARGITKDGIFDETGPDLLMHGVSRYGFGPGVLGHDWWYPKFDASANGSMGKVIPGFAEVMHGLNTGKATNDLLSEGAARAAGAGYGTVFALMHALNDPGSADSKKWANLLMPRALKAVYTANRYGLSQIGGLLGVPGLEQPLAATDSKGARITKFDPNDPQDIATILMQALGVSSTKVNETWEMIREKNDALSLYKMRKSTIYVQMQKAVEENNPQALEDMQKAIRLYNEEVSQVDPQMVIKGMQLQSSMKQRLQQKNMMEQTLAKNKGEYGLTQRVMDLYPGVRAERVR